MLLLFLVFFTFINFSNASDIYFDNDPAEIHYCDWEDDYECWLKEWIDAIKEKTPDEIVKEDTASIYSQKVVNYLLWFIYLISVFIIIYAWFNILTSIGDEEKMKNSKRMIIYVIIWTLIIFLAYPIIDFVDNVLSNWNSGSNIDNTSE